MENPYSRFKKESDAVYHELVADYDSIVGKARDKWGAHQTYHNITYRNKMDTAYAKLGNTAKLFHDMKDEYRKDNTREWKEIFNEKLNTIQGDNETLIGDLAVYAGLDTFLDYWIAQDKVVTMDGEVIPQEIKSGIEWKGNKTEFMQLVYSLYHSGYLTNREEEITKLVNDIAKMWNIELGKNWQSDISKNLTLRNNDYQFEIFDKMKGGLVKHQQERITKKK